VQLFLFPRKKEAGVLTVTPALKHSTTSLANRSEAVTGLAVLRLKVFRANFLSSEGSRSQTPASAPRRGAAGRRLPAPRQAPFASSFRMCQGLPSPAPRDRARPHGRPREAGKVAAPQAGGGRQPQQGRRQGWPGREPAAGAASPQPPPRSRPCLSRQDILLPEPPHRLLAVPQPRVQLLQGFIGSLVVLLQAEARRWRRPVLCLELVEKLAVPEIHLGRHLKLQQEGRGLGAGGAAEGAKGRRSRRSQREAPGGRSPR